MESTHSSLSSKEQGTKYDERNIDSQEEKEYNDDYDEKYLNVICWNCGVEMIAGNSWGKVKCPICSKISLLPVEKKQVSEWERILEMKHIKITCERCKKVIYVKRESEFVTCSDCENVMTIVKKVPLRPSVYSHEFSHSVVVQTPDNLKKEREYVPPPKLSNMAKFLPLLQTVRTNEYNLMKMTKNKK